MEVSLSWQMISRRLGRSGRSTVLQVGFGGCVEVSYSRWLFIGDWWTKLRSRGMIEWVDIVPFPFSWCRCFGVYWPVLRPGTECKWFKGAMQHIRRWASKCCLHRDKLQTRFGCDVKHTTGIDKLIAMPMNISIAFYCNVLVSCFLSQILGPVWGATGRLLRGDFYLEWRRILVRLQGHQHALRGAKPPDDSMFVFVPCWAAQVDNIITEPNLTSTAFVMFGTREAQRSIHDCRCQWIKVGQAARPPQFSTFFQVSFTDLLLVSWCPGWCPPFHGLTQGWQRCSLLSEVRFARALRSCRSCTVRCLSDLLIQLTQHNHTTPWINWILWTSSPKGCGH